MIQYPNISPYIIKYGALEVRWYGLMYIIAFLIGWWFLKKYNRRDHLHLSKDDITDLILFMLGGVVIGGRLGYIWFYNFSYYLEHPTSMFKVWEGGMSFHGGLIGVILMTLYYAKSRQVNFYTIADILVIPGSLGIALGRLGNFINAELYGRATDVAWCMQFPTDSLGICRHPSQLYELVLEGLVLMAILVVLKHKKLTPGIVAWSFIAGYGVMRSIVEFFREPDVQIGYYAGTFTQGQLLSLPLILIGLGMIIYTIRTKGLLSVE